MRHTLPYYLRLALAFVFFITLVPMLYVFRPLYKDEPTEDYEL